MKTFICAFLSLVVVCVEARAALQFEGFMSDSGSVRFVLSDSESGRRSLWLSIGDSFEGHRVVSFDSRSEVLTLQRANDTLRLPLKPPSTLQGESLQPEKGAIVVLLGNDRRLVVSDDPSRLASLLAEFQHAAASDPKPGISLRIPQDTKMSLIKLVMDMCRESGLGKIHIKIESSEVR